MVKLVFECSNIHADWNRFSIGVKMTEETLSDKRAFISGAYVNKKNKGYVYPEKDVKNFIKKLREEILDLSIMEEHANLGFKGKFVEILDEKIDKIFGEELSK